MSTDQHRLWFKACCGRHGRTVSPDLSTIFANRMQDLLAAYERQEPINHELLESMRIREYAKLLKEAGHG